eukprot:TRINITY_DN1232_c0_g1_i10.p1 TRINITY_DN1232_c0_g1~~TRINITY_DN1232_c0_g1_i10.p1  ORF type:complete len:135 (+),score=45.14 TRINITY_DN1232_c0_g1_i10:67-471(+)
MCIRDRRRVHGEVLKHQRNLDQIKHQTSSGKVENFRIHRKKINSVKRSNELDENEVGEQNKDEGKITNIEGQLQYKDEPEEVNYEGKLQVCEEVIQPEEAIIEICKDEPDCYTCLLYTSPSPRDRQKSRMPSSA